MASFVFRKMISVIAATVVLGSLTAGCSTNQADIFSDDSEFFAAGIRSREDLSRVVETAIKGGWDATLEELLQLEAKDVAARKVLSQLSGESYALHLAQYFEGDWIGTYVLCFVQTSTPSTLSPPCVFCVVVLALTWDETGIKGLSLASASARRWRCFDSAFISKIDTVHQADTLRILVRLDALSPEGELLTGPDARDVALIFEYDATSQCFTHENIEVDGKERSRDQLPRGYPLPEDSFLTSCGGDES